MTLRSMDSSQNLLEALAALAFPDTAEDVDVSSFFLEKSVDLAVQMPKKDGAYRLLLSMVERIQVGPHDMTLHTRVIISALRLIDSLPWDEKTSGCFIGLLRATKSAPLPLQAQLYLGARSIMQNHLSQFEKTSAHGWWKPLLSFASRAIDTPMSSDALELVALLCHAVRKQQIALDMDMTRDLIELLIGFISR